MLTLNIDKFEKSVLTSVLAASDCDINFQIDVGTNGDMLVLEKSLCHFAGFKPAVVISLYVLENVGDDEFHTVKTEYFSTEHKDTAVEAFTERYNNPHEVSGLSDRLSDFLDVEQY